jgi:hypothetical protein
VDLTGSGDTTNADQPPDVLFRNDIESLSFEFTNTNADVISTTAATIFDEPIGETVAEKEPTGQLEQTTAPGVDKTAIDIKEQQQETTTTLSSNSDDQQATTVANDQATAESFEATTTAVSREELKSTTLGSVEQFKSTTLERLTVQDVELVGNTVEQEAVTQESRIEQDFPRTQGNTVQEEGVTTQVGLKRKRFFFIFAKREKLSKNEKIFAKFCFTKVFVFRKVFADKFSRKCYILTPIF